jgi:hypothetical protein
VNRAFKREVAAKVHQTRAGARGRPAVECSTGTHGGTQGQARGSTVAASTPRSSFPKNLSRPGCCQTSGSASGFFAFGRSSEDYRIQGEAVLLTCIPGCAQVALAAVSLPLLRGGFVGRVDAEPRLWTNGDGVAMSIPHAPVPKVVDRTSASFVFRQTPQREQQRLLQGRLLQKMQQSISGCSTCGLTIGTSGGSGPDPLWLATNLAGPITCPDKSYAPGAGA